jgi:dimethylamine/trimethylamine dehydrogenase
MGEEWRRGWHPESVPEGKTDKTVLIVGAGPCGLEAARIAGERGYQVMLAEAYRHLGGRVTAESTLPGLQEWARVRDYRVQQIEQMDNVKVFPESLMTPESIMELCPDHVGIATGSRWSIDGGGRFSESEILGLADSAGIVSVDQAIGGEMPVGSYVIYDDDHYYMASALAEKLALQGNRVCYVTPSDSVATWSARTVERFRVHSRLHDLEIEMVTAHSLVSFSDRQVTLQSTYTSDQKVIESDYLVPVTSRQPVNDLYQGLADLIKQGNDPGKICVGKIGDCDAPGLIADAVFAGHRWARELDCETDTSNPMKYDRVFYTES